MNKEDMTVEELAADFGVPVEDVMARRRWDDLLLTDLDGRYPLTGEEGARTLRAAASMLSGLWERSFDDEVVVRLVGDNDAMRMLLEDAAVRARIMAERVETELED